MGHFALQLGIARMRSFDPIRRTASEAIVDLGTETRLTTALSVWGSFGPTVIYIHEGTDQLHINTRAGTVYSVTGTATGLAFAAYLPQDLVKAAIKAELAETQATQRVGARLDLPGRSAASCGSSGSTVMRPSIRRRFQAKIHAIAAPVFDSVGQVRMVITLIGSAATIDVGAGSRHVEQILETARALNDQMGYFPSFHEKLPASEPEGDTDEPARTSTSGRKRAGGSKLSLVGD